MLFNNSKEMFIYLLDYYKKNGGPVEILTFGMYLGITKGKLKGEGYKDWQGIYPMDSRAFIEATKKELKTIVGMPFFIECKLDCKDCKIAYNKMIERHEATAEYIGLNIKYLGDMHMKMYRVGDLVVLGGMNLSDSDWVDCSLIANKEDGLRVTKLFKKLWEHADAEAKRYYKK